MATPFLDINALTGCPVPPAGDCGERGLLGLAFHPDYASNGQFFVFYTRAPDGALVLARYLVSANPDVAATPGTTLLVIPHPAGNHNGGQLAFRDGLLYVATGDGGGAGDPDENAQDVDSLLGKLDAASTKLAGGKSADAVDKLVGFQGTLAALATAPKPKVDPAVAQGLSTDAQAVIDCINAIEAT